EAGQEGPADLPAHVEDALAGAPIPARAVVTARVDDELAAVARLEACVDAVGGVVFEVVQAGERRPVLRLDGRLRMRAKELVAALAKSRQRIWARDPVEVADLAPPVDQIEIRLRVS